MHRGLCQFKRAIERNRIKIIAIEWFNISVHVSLGQHRCSARIVRVDREGLFEQTPRVIDRRFCASAHMQQKCFRPSQVKVIGLRGGRRFQQRSFGFGSVYMSRERRDNRTRHLVLDREHVMQLAVVSLGPPVNAGRCLDKLRGDANPLAAPPNAALQHVSRAQLFPNLPYIDRLAFVLEARISSDDQKLGKARQLGDDVLGNAVAEIVLLGSPLRLTKGSTATQGRSGSIGPRSGEALRGLRHWRHRSRVPPCR